MISAIKTLKYKLRYSNKAKYLQLRVSNKGVEIVVPLQRHLTENQLNDFILQKMDWIQKTQRRYSLETDHSVQAILPESIVLPAINQRWAVSYIATQHRCVTIHANSAGELKLMGPIHDNEACRYLLKEWLKQTAAQYLSVMLRNLASEVGLTFQNVSIRNNQTRWGSCSSRKNISLCCRLLFLPTHLVKHVLLHELCHTKVMHHGKSFWALLERLDTNTPKHVKELKKAVALVPCWL